MNPVTLGRTRITVNKNAFGALPIQRIGFDESTLLLRKAFNSGITFFDTARFYTDSEQKIGIALNSVRDKIIIATKTMCANADDFRLQLATSLANLQTSYIDIYQFHNPAFCPKPGDGTGLYEAMLEAKSEGLIRHIGLTNHRLAVAFESVESGLYDTLQFPLSYLATDRELELVQLCKTHNVGFIAMKSLAGGLITNSAAAYAFLAQFENVLPIWGIQKESELDEFITYIPNPPVMTPELAAIIENDKSAFSEDFCRGCGYCMPCPSGIDIATCARMSLLIRRAPTSIYLGDEWQKKMRLITGCIHCGQCKKRCPYGLDTPKLLEKNWADYKEFV